MCYNKAMENKKKLLLIDGSSVAYRAFFALYNQIDRFKNRYFAERGFCRSRRDPFCHPFGRNCLKETV